MMKKSSKSNWSWLIIFSVIVVIAITMYHNHKTSGGKSGIWIVDQVVSHLRENHQLRQDLEFANESWADQKICVESQREIIGGLEEEVVSKNQQIRKLKSSLAVAQRINWFGEITCKLISLIVAHDQKQEKYIKYLEYELSKAQRTTTLYLSVPDGQIEVYLKSTPQKKHPRANL